MLKKAILYRVLTVFGVALLLSTLGACRDDFETSPSTGSLEFSRDTIFLDTVFSNIGSSTYTLKVYNRSNNLINIPQITLSKGQNSDYRLNVDGLAGNTFENIEILPCDSIFVFVETTLDFNSIASESNTFLSTDAITFDTGANEQAVQLVTLVQDAVFLFPQRDSQGIKESLNLGQNAEGEPVLIEGFFLDDDALEFTAEKPYVIYGYAAVPPGKTLNINAGARIHFHEGSGIIVVNSASLQVNGTLSQDTLALENEVIFEGDRLETLFSDVPGQWGTIWLTAGSINNKISHATIKNATIGILADANAGDGNPTLSIDNSQIYNSSNIGLLAQTATINGENLVINNSGINSLYLSLGGNYNFNQSTFVNYWDQGFRQGAAVQIDNFAPTADGTLVADLVQANFTNCIIDGNRNEELQLNPADEALFNYKFTNCLIRFEDVFEELTGIAPYIFEDTARYTNIILNGNPDFKDEQNNDLQIGDDSAANGSALPSSANQVPLDILGRMRPLNNSDLGAYESVIFDVEE